MKTLLKFLCAMALGLFITTNVVADNPQWSPGFNLTPATGNQIQGHVGCNVPQYLALCCTPANVHFEFVYSGFPGASHLTDANSAEIKGNIPWTFKITPAGPSLLNPAGNALPANGVKVAIDGGAEQILTDVPTMNGTMNDVLPLAWRLDVPDVNYPAGIYTVGVTYSVAPLLVP